MAKMDVQGPNSAAAVQRAAGLDVAGLRYFHFADTSVGSARVIVSRTGYTGETGYEIYAETPVLVRLWEKFVAAGVKPAGLGARDTLRLEAGLPLYGHELTENVTPLEAGMGRYASKPEPFVGQAALARKREKGVDSRLVGFTLQGRASARTGNRVLAGTVDVGRVTSGSFSPTLGHAIGMAYVRPDLAVPGTRLGVDTGRRVEEATVAALPFYRAAGR